MEISPKPLGLETLPFQFAFYLCHRNNQTSGERGKSGAFEERIRTFRLLPFPLFAGCERTFGQIKDVRWWRMLWIIRWSDFVKATRTERMRIRNRLSPPAILNAPSGFQFASEDSRFLSSADSRVCLIALSVSCTPTRLWDLSDDINAFTTVGCAFRYQIMESMAGDWLRSG